MKLIDILVQEFPKRGGWPEGAKTVAQDSCGECWWFDCCNPKIKNGLWWVSDSGTDLIASSKVQLDLLADDWSSTFITREQYEAALAAKNDGWIDWDGGECPVDTKTLVDIRLKVGFTYKSCHPGDYSWRHAGGGGDIFAYRLHNPQEVTEADDETELNECIGQDVATAWSGEGKPTVGTKCEHHSGGQWEVVTIAGIYENLVTGFTDYWMVKEDGCSYTVGNPYRFRPIRSEADKKRDDMANAIDGFISGFKNEKIGSNKKLAYALTDYLALLEKL